MERSFIIRLMSFEMHISYDVWWGGINLNMILVAYLSRDVSLEDILEGAHLYEFDC